MVNLVLLLIYFAYINVTNNNKYYGIVENIILIILILIILIDDNCNSFELTHNLYLCDYIIITADNGNNRILLIFFSLLF